MPEDYLHFLRQLCDRHDLLLIFDEVRTGFRLHIGGAQAQYGVTPDLTALGKAMSNGYPQTALVGCREVMSGAAIAPGNLETLRLVTRLQDPDVEVSELAVEGCCECEGYRGAVSAFSPATMQRCDARSACVRGDSSPFS